MKFALSNFMQKIISGNGCKDAVVDSVVSGNKLDLYLSATRDKIKFIELKCKFESIDDIFVLGDAWERSYADLELKKVTNNATI